MTSQSHSEDVARAFLLLLLAFPSLTCAVPSVSLEGCPEGYALNSSSCTCKAANLSSSFRALLWKDPSKNTVLHSRESDTFVTLPFSKVQPEFNGLAYTCEVVDGDHQQVISYNPRVAEPPSLPVLRECPMDYILPSDKAANCTCIITNPGVPPPILIWEDPDQRVVTHSESRLSLSLFFTSIRASYSQRVYHCILRHVTGDLKVPYTPLLVVKPASPEIVGIKEKYREGENVELKCTVKGGVPVVQKIVFYCLRHPDRPDKIVDSYLLGSLTFRAQKTDNNTLCICYGSNDFFISSIYSFNIHVGEKEGAAEPLISLQHCPLYFVAGTSSCSCIAENLGNSSVTLIWIDPDGQTVMYNRTSKLTLTLLDKRFNGRQYRCDLLHSSGAQSILYTFKMAVPPSPPFLENCTKDNVRAYKDDAICTCMTSNLGLPAALLVWYDPDHRPVVFTRNEKSLVLPFSAVNTTFRGQAYRCILRHITGDFSVQYIPPCSFNEVDKEDGLSGGKIAGIVIGVIVIIAVIAGLVIGYRNKKGCRPESKCLQ